MFYVADLDYAKELSQKLNKPLIIADNLTDITNTPFDAVFYVENSDDRFFKLDRDIVFKEYNTYSVIIPNTKTVDEDLIQRFKKGIDVEKELKLSKTDTGVELIDFLNALQINIPALEYINCNKKIIYREVRRQQTCTRLKTEYL